ncbi:hypothetical protein DY000_02015708 [Brassica cretica]|uniref:Uncharacterized protein n=1 Tax=Brassica cretica TaxID=69181 RepID=A0ABQ7CQP3_BRACR|nr:hypothetical protein DY000_02015708 [Brassica cretica]
MDKWYLRTPPAQIDSKSETKANQVITLFKRYKMGNRWSGHNSQKSQFAWSKPSCPVTGGDGFPEQSPTATAAEDASGGQRLVDVTPSVWNSCAETIFDGGACNARLWSAKLLLTWGSRLTNNLIMEPERTHNGGVGVGALQRCELGANGPGSSHGAGCHKKVQVN